MKKVYPFCQSKQCLFLTVLFLTFSFACSTEGELQRPEFMELTMLFESSASENGFIEIEVTYATNNPGELFSDDLIKVKNVEDENSDYMANFYKLKGLDQSSVRNGRTNKIEKGYFFTQSGCWVYGTLFTDDSTGASIFVPCGINCIGLDPICPPGDDEYASINKKRYKNLS